MEPNAVNSDQALENALRSLRQAPLPDEGFSARVLAALPESRPPAAFPWMSTLTWATAAAGLVWILRGTSGAELSHGLGAAVSDCTQSLSGLWSPLGLAGVLGLCAYVVLSNFENEKSRD